MNSQGCPRWRGSLCMQLHVSQQLNPSVTTGKVNSPVAMMSPGADSLDRMGILRSWRLSSWLSRWARWREQPWESCNTSLAVVIMWYAPSLPLKAEASCAHAAAGTKEGDLAQRRPEPQPGCPHPHPRWTWSSAPRQCHSWEKREKY